MCHALGGGCPEHASQDHAAPSDAQSPAMEQAHRDRAGHAAPGLDHHVLRAGSWVIAGRSSKHGEPNLHGSRSAKQVTVASPPKSAAAGGTWVASTTSRPPRTFSATRVGDPEARVDPITGSMAIRRCTWLTVRRSRRTWVSTRLPVHRHSSRAAASLAEQGRNRPATAG